VQLRLFEGRFNNNVESPRTMHAVAMTMMVVAMEGRV
jgi:hypothetical protein